MGMPTRRAPRAETTTCRLAAPSQTHSGMLTTAAGSPSSSRFRRRLGGASTSTGPELTSHEVAGKAQRERSRATLRSSPRPMGMHAAIFSKPWPSCALVALTLLGCATEATLPRKALELNTLGAQALASGDLSGAEARLAVALEYSPRFVEAWISPRVRRAPGAAASSRARRDALARARAEPGHLPRRTTRSASSRRRRGRGRSRSRSIAQR